MKDFKFAYTIGTLSAAAVRLRWIVISFNR